jgi:hypothetical protein
LTWIWSFTKGKTPTQYGSAVLHTHLHLLDRYFSFSLPKADLSPTGRAHREYAVPAQKSTLFAAESVLVFAEFILDSAGFVPFSAEFTPFAAGFMLDSAESAPFTTEYTLFTGEIVVLSRVRFVAA